MKGEEYLDAHDFELRIVCGGIRLYNLLFVFGVRKWFMSVFRNMKKREQKNSEINDSQFNSMRIYEALTPKDNINNGEEYLAALDWALNQPNIHNIAVSGPYGAGKSSVIKTYLNKHPESDAVYVSLATFDLKEYDDSGIVQPDDSQTRNKKVEEELESAILKQLFYSVNAKKIPRSRYRKIQVGLSKTSILITVALLVTLFALLYFSFPEKTNEFLKMVCGLGIVKGLFVCIILLGASFFLLLFAVDWFRRSGNVKEINILNKATLGSNSSSAESIFNKNLDEIVYFFESTKKKIMIIEDLDRFDNTSIFVALRELNGALNNYENINGSVKFVYAIRDDMFRKTGERTKFFDFIIPIIPFISSTNSGEILRQKLNNEFYEISEKYISMVSPYLSDMRDLLCICNEFNVFKRLFVSLCG